MNEEADTVSVLDAASFKEVARVPVGKGPAQVGFTPDGQLAFVSLSEENTVVVIDPATRKTVRRVAVETVPIQLYATPDSRTATAERIGKELGIDIVLADVLPGRKASKIKALQAQGNRSAWSATASTMPRPAPVGHPTGFSIRSIAGSAASAPWSKDGNLKITLM